MSTIAKLWIVLGALSAALSVGMGAYHAHGLIKFLQRQSLDPTKIAERMDQFEVAARYEMYHVLAMVAVGLLIHLTGSKWFSASGVCFLLGTLLFCGCLYIPVLTGVKLPWPLVPSGGMAFMVGWILFAWGALVQRLVER